MKPSPSSYPPVDLNGWLAYLESIHPQSIEMGLDRVRRVYDNLALEWSGCRVVTVAGTNGKGSTCTVIEQGARQAGQSVAVYASPHLLDYRERVRLNGNWFSEAEHCQAFARVEKARGDISLTYFEFGTLAALSLIASANVDLAVLEVGLGGRLDAVNVIAPDLAVITCIDLDHSAWLGDSREAIALEKAGIVRDHAPVVIGDPEPPLSLIQAMKERQAEARWVGLDFGFKASEDGFEGWIEDTTLSWSAGVNLHPVNAITGLAALKTLGLLDEARVAELLAHTQVPGRCQLLGRSPQLLVDVAHNPQAVAYLTSRIADSDFERLHLVVGMLQDKAVLESLTPLLKGEANWYLATLPPPRGLSASQLKSLLPVKDSVLEFDTVEGALDKARANAGKQDLIVAFGSFLTAGAALKWHQFA